jgi:repressor LexA
MTIGLRRQTMDRMGLMVADDAARHNEGQWVVHTFPLWEVDGVHMYTYDGGMETEAARTTLAKFWKAHRRVPTWREMMRLFGYRSPNAVTKMVGRLQRAGILGRNPDGRLTFPHPWGLTRMLGTVEAGWPSPAEEELADTMSLDEWLIGNREATFMLKVKGQSMLDAGIMPGDTVLVERGVTPRDGDIVVAEVDGAWTMKYLRHQGGRPVLVPANAKFRTIIPSSELNIAAVVKAVIRKY